MQQHSQQAERGFMHFKIPVEGSIIVIIKKGFMKD